MPVVLMHQQTLQNLIPTPKVWLSKGLAGPSDMATVWDQATGNRAVRPSGRGSIRGWPLHSGEACAPALAPGPCLTDAVAMPEPGHADWNSGLTVDLSYPIVVPGDLSCCQSLAAIPGPALLALLCPACPTDSPAPTWLSLAEQIHFGFSPTYPL